MRHFAKFLTCSALLLIAAALLLGPQFASSQAPPMPGMQHVSTDEPVPAYHAQPAQGELPPTMEPSLFTDKLIFNAYVVAGRVKKVLYQQPCYCHCDRSQGHGSLLDCFVSRHGSGCDICMKEAFYSYEQTRRGKKPEQIREGIMRGDWQKVDVAKYQRDYLPPISR
ncbi:MAG: CYCXC family (seleno)protein [Candidatus Acidiferrum sp.]